MDYKESFLRYLQLEKRYSPNTVRSYRNDLNQFYSFIEKSGCVPGSSEIASSDIRAWIVELVESGISARSVHRKITTLSSYLKYLRKEGVATGDPLAKVVLPKTKKRLPVFVDNKVLNDALNIEDYEKWDDFEKSRDYMIIDTLYMTGMRRAELIGLRDSDVDFAECAIKVTGKRNKQRIIPITEKFRDRLKKYKSLRDAFFERPIEGDFFFVTKTGKKLYDKFVYNTVNNFLSLITTIDKKSPHVLRHTFATHMLNSGADLNVIKEFLGHASLAATQVYTHNTFEQLKKSYDKAHPRA